MPFRGWANTLYFTVLHTLKFYEHTSVARAPRISHMHGDITRKRSNVHQRATWPPPWQCVDPKVALRWGLYSPFSNTCVVVYISSTCVCRYVRINVWGCASHRRSTRVWRCVYCARQEGLDRCANLCAIMLRMMPGVFRGRRVSGTRPQNAYGDRESLRYFELCYL